MKPFEPRTSIQAFIFAEGGSPRLRPLTEHLPTCLVPVGGTPILDHQLQALLRLGIRSITVVGGYRAAQVEAACRVYSGVLFRANPKSTRGEPLRSSILAATPEPGRPGILLRGDLVLDDSLIEALLTSGTPDAQIVGPSGRGIGLCLAGSETMRVALEAAGRTASTVDGELFPWIEGILNEAGAVALPAGNRPWARMTSMEDLARALKARRDAQAARVAEIEIARENSNSTGTEPLQDSPPASTSTEAPNQETPATGGSPVLTRSLLRVLPL